jgi:hypothetical protein
MNEFEGVGRNLKDLKEFYGILTNFKEFEGIVRNFKEC